MARAAEIRALPAKNDDDLRRFELSVSSEAPVRRWFGYETLSHDESAVDMTRMDDGAPVLHQHDGGQQIGVVESARLDGQRLVATVAFSRASTLAQEVAQDIADGIRRNVSIGYMVERAKLVETDEEGADHWLITRWQPMEISVVGVPADASVGFGRAQPGDKTFPVQIESTHQFTHRPAPTRAPCTMGTRAMSDQNTQQPSRSERRAQAQDRGDAQEIARLAHKHGLAHRAAEWIGSGKSAQEVAREILEVRAAQQQNRAPSGIYVGSGLPADRAEARDMEVPRGYSVANAILSAAAGENSLEREWSDDYARVSGRTGRQNGIFVHPRAVFSRAMDSITATAATELVAQQQGELIELLRPVARVVALGAQVMSNLIGGGVPFPKHKSGAAATWMQENPGSDVPESDSTFGSVILNPKTLMGHSQFSRQLLVQSSINVEQFVRRDLTSAHGLAIDRAALHGSGNANQPLGIYKTPDVNTEAMGGNPTYAKLVSMATKIASDNAYLGNLGWLTTPGMAGKLMTILEFASSGSKAIWTGNLLEGLVAGSKAAATTQVSSLMSTLEPTGGTEHGIVFGNWLDLMIGLWGALELVTDPYTQARKGLILVTSFQMADVALRHGESFAVATGATIA